MPAGFDMDHSKTMDEDTQSFVDDLFSDPEFDKPTLRLPAIEPLVEELLSEEVSLDSLFERD
ncbi:MAG: hypothetical protein SFW67_00750 [Myxococcaceae bacterium]|nr:hypothetical protein [Myxococcaceae bacterium]